MTSGTEAVAVFVDGFAADPWFRWLWPDDENYPRHAAAWFGLVTEVVTDRGRVVVDDDAAALWMPPGSVLVDDTTSAAAASLLHSQLGARADEALAALGASAAHDPSDPHFSCVYVAVRRRAQGLGLGERVMRTALEDADTDGTGVHLVSTNDRNLGFYRRLGFEVVAELQPLSDLAVTFRPMWRRPATPSSS